MRARALAFPVPARSDRQELLDDPAAVAAEIPANLADIRRLNRWFGDRAILLHDIKPWIREWNPCSVLDIATGSADIPVALHAWSRSADLEIEISALDLFPQVLAEARSVVGQKPIRLYQGDALSLPFRDGAFDIVTCCLALHHFEPSDAERVLSEMWRVAARGVLVVDLTRGYIAHAGTWLATHAFGRSRLTRHDGPLSVMRAYTVDELQSLARMSGLEQVRVRRRHPFRQTLWALKGMDSAT